MISNKDILETFNTEIEKTYTISWKMTEGCNYHCPYCIAQSPGKKFDGYEKVKNIAYKIHELTEQINKPIMLHFVGGEPSMYDLKELTKIIGIDKLTKINLISNFSRDVNYYIDYCNFCKDNKLKLNLLLSYHPTECDKQEFLDKLYKVRQVHKISVGLVFNNDNIEKDVVNYCFENDIRINLSIERDLNNNALKLTEENRQYFDTIESMLKLNRAKKSERNSMKITMINGDILWYTTSSSFISDILEGGFIPDNRYCSGGVTSLRILPNGDVARAGCNYCQNNLLLGNILTDKIVLPTKPFLCKQNEGSNEIKFCPLCYKVNTKRMM